MLPLNGDGDSLLTPLCLFRAQTMARNFNGASSSQTRFFLSVFCVCVTCIIPLFYHPTGPGPNRQCVEGSLFMFICLHSQLYSTYKCTCEYVCACVEAPNEGIAIFLVRLPARLEACQRPKKTKHGNSRKETQIFENDV